MTELTIFEQRNFRKVGFRWQLHPFLRRDARGGFEDIHDLRCLGSGQVWPDLGESVEHPLGEGRGEGDARIDITDDMARDEIARPVQNRQLREAKDALKVVLFESPRYLILADGMILSFAECFIVK